MSEESPEDAGQPEERAAEDAHLTDMPDGCGCVEVWEVLSERRLARETDEGKSDPSSREPPDSGERS